MASETASQGLGRVIVGRWHTGVGAGIAGVIPMIVFNTFWVGNSFESLFSLLPFAVLWGVAYAGVASVGPLARLATAPPTGVGAGVVYSFVVWMGPQVGEPIGQGVFTVNGVVQIVLFGAVLGLVYAYSPYVEGRAS